MGFVKDRACQGEALARIVGIADAAGWKWHARLSSTGAFQ